MGLNPVVLPTWRAIKPQTLRGAKGCYRVGQVSDGRWWLLSPDGAAFFCNGINGVDTMSSGKLLLSSASAPGAIIQGLDHSTVDELSRWGFNTLGIHSAPVLKKKSGLAYTVNMEFIRCASKTIRSSGICLPDVFDRDWVEACSNKAEQVCFKLRQDASLLGYFTDDSMLWGAPGEQGHVMAPGLLQICLSLEPSYAAYHAAWEFILAMHGGSLSALSKAWDIKLSHRIDVRQLTVREVLINTPGYLQDELGFTRQFARRYFEVTSSAIRTFDPDHLILGSRFVSHPGEAVLSASVFPQVDINSMAVMAPSSLDMLPVLAAHAMPVLISEFSWEGPRFTAPRDAVEMDWSELERMISHGRKDLGALMAHPFIVGWFWRKWADQAGSRNEMEGFGGGLIRADGSVAIEHVMPLTTLNMRAVLIHASGTA